MPVFNPNPNMFQQLDYGAAVQSGQQIKYNRLRNEALGREEKKQQDMLKNRQRAAEIRSSIDGMPAQIDALENDGLFEQADKLRDTYIKTRKAEVEITEQMREGVSADNYDQVRQGMLEEGTIVPGLWPETYSDDWFRKKADTAKSALKKFTRTQFDKGAVMSQDIVSKGGDIIWEGEPYPTDRDGGGDGDGFEFKASDTNAIARQVERAYNVTYDPVTKAFTGLDKEKTQKLMALQEEAERIYAEGGGKTSHGVAMAQAGRKLRFNIPDVRDRMVNDPAGIRPR